MEQVTSLIWPLRLTIVHTIAFLVPVGFGKGESAFTVEVSVGLFSGPPISCNFAECSVRIVRQGQSCSTYARTEEWGEAKAYNCVQGVGS